MSWRIVEGDCRDVLAGLPAGSVQTCVTSPPYWGLRDYGVDGQLGLEQTPEQYVAEMVAVFAEVRRVLRGDGTLWLNLGDSYAATTRSAGASLRSTLATKPTSVQTTALRNCGSWATALGAGLKPKDLVGIPWRVAFALQADGWFLRSDIIWAKPNPMPESVTDRPTKAHEYVFLLSKSRRYFYDADALRQPHTSAPVSRNRWQNGGGSADSLCADSSQEFGRMEYSPLGRNARTVWPIATQPYSGAHFATMPPALVERCVKAGSKPGDVVLDPFAGAGTTLLVADRLGRDAIGVELNSEYAALARDRITDEAPMFAREATAPTEPDHPGLFA